MTSLIDNTHTAGKDLLASIASANPTLHSQLTTLISHLIQHKPSDPFQSLEKLSSTLLNPTPTSHPLLSSPAPTSLTSYLTSTPFLFNAPPPPASTDDEPTPADDPTPIPSSLPDLTSLASLLTEAGLSLSDEELVHIDRALVSLSQRDGVESIRFFGKFFTTSGRDYYVFEVKKGGYDDDEEQERVARERLIQDTGDDLSINRELLGSGANEYLYYTSQSIDQPLPTFTPLPSTTPRSIVDARHTHRLLTGDLTAAVGGFPKFSGSEADLLRAQVARIGHATVVVPRGSWKEEEGEVVIEDEGWTGVKPGDRVEWVHVRGHLREEGRVEPVPVDDEEEGESKVVDKRPLLAGVSEGFSVRVSGRLDSGRLETVEGDDGVVVKGLSGLVASCWSVAWPGSVSVVRGREYGSVYIGWGVKRGTGRIDKLTERQVEWEGELTEQVEVLATEEEEKKEREDEAEKQQNEEKKPEDEEDELPGDDEDKEEED